MFGIFASALSKIGSFAANLGSQACICWYWDEAKMPKQLLK